MVISWPFAAASGASILDSALFAQAFPLRRNVKRTATYKRMSFFTFLPMS